MKHLSSLSTMIAQYFVGCLKASTHIYDNSTPQQQPLPRAGLQNMLINGSMNISKTTWC